MLRRFVGLAVAALTGATLLVGASAFPAQADLQDDVCAQMPNKLIASQAAVEQATNTRNAAASTLTTRRAELDAAVVAYVNAFGDLILAKDAGTGESVAQTAYDAAGEIVAARASAWGNAKIALFEAQHELDIASTVHLMNTTLDAKLGCEDAP